MQNIAHKLPEFIQTRSSQVTNKAGMMDLSNSQKINRSPQNEQKRHIGDIKSPQSTPKFPIKLHNLLDKASQDPDLSCIISWLPCGRAFRIHDVDRFVELLLPVYFQSMSSFKSFRRQLNLYGIRKQLKADLSANRSVVAGSAYFSIPERQAFLGAYYHPSFQRDQKELAGNMTRVAMSNKPRICSVSSNSSATTISTSNAFYVQLHSERASSKLPPQPRLKSHMKDIFDGQASAEILGLGAIPYGADVGEVTGAFRAACARADQRLRESCDTNPLWYDSSIQPFDPVEKERCDRWLLLAASNYSALVASSLDMNDTHATKGCCFESKPTSSASSSCVEGTICDPEFCLGRIPSKSERFDLSVEDFSHREDEKDIHHGINIQTEIIRTFVASDLRADYRNAMIR